MKRLILKLIGFYQLFISPNLGINCRFYPSCSHYAADSVKKYGVIKGSQKSFLRILKCVPWSPGGIDLP